MKRWITVAAMMLLCGLGSFAQADVDGSLIKTGDKVPAFTFEIEKGKTVSIADYKGKLVLINLFATWCPPCRKELPEMQKQVWEKHSKNDKFALFVFGREENWDVLNPFKEKFKYTFPILPDVGRGVFGKFATQSIPRNILIDENGTIIYQSIGYEPAEFKKLIELIDKKLKSNFHLSLKTHY
ncbi:TlpA family protein disulfide reductase [Niabella sp. W65]|nr:TlpA family protein disulfide reductase [Niabella sp. W65]MCH7368387.1 TlpA family protein disulfide reductase [Niabella sp. W65]ULT43985.1 TlpA family protein disulfide reductase [Niabella sp. I65]